MARGTVRMAAGLGATLVALACGSTCPDSPVCEDNTVVSCEECSGSGFFDSCTPSERDCGNDVCVEAQGAAACVDPAMEACTSPHEYVGLRCSGDTLEQKLCTATGYFVGGTRVCWTGSVCVEAYGAADCVDPSAPVCDPTVEAGDGMFCTTDGQSTVQGTCNAVGYVSTGMFPPDECDPSELCFADVSPAACLVSPREPCDPNDYTVWSRCEGDMNVIRSCVDSGYTEDDWFTCGEGGCVNDPVGPYGRCAEY